MTSPDSEVKRLKQAGKPRPKGNRLEDFEVGRRFIHHWGRTMSKTDSELFTLLTLHYNPQYTNEEFAIAHGHVTTPINPLLVFNTVFGLSVEDLSEGGGPFLGVNALCFGVQVYPGDTVYSESEVIATRVSGTRPGYGIVTWKTLGINQLRESVVTFERSNLVRTRG